MYVNLMIHKNKTIIIVKFMCLEYNVICKICNGFASAFRLADINMYIYVWYSLFFACSQPEIS